MAAEKKRKYVPKEGPNAEDRALERFAELIIEKLETIKDNWKKPWFTENTMQWPRNLNGREYNGMNALLLMLHSEKQGYKMPVFMTFNSMESLNFSKGNLSERKPLKDKEGNELSPIMIQKGEKSFPVFLTTFTVVHKETKEKIKYDEYKQLAEDKRNEYNVYPKMQVYNVFNVDQSNMKEVRPELYNKLMSENRLLPPEITPDAYNFPAIDEMIKNNEWLCPIKLQHQDEAYYSISGDKIVLPEKSQFYKAEDFYGTALHEMIHSTGAEDRLDRFGTEARFGSEEYAKEELVAELGSALTMQKYGLTKTIKNDSCTYLKSWLDKLKASPEFLKTVLGDVKKATAIVNEHIDKINVRLNDKLEHTEKAEILPVTKIPENAKVEICTTDKESLDAILHLFKNNIYRHGEKYPIPVSNGKGNSAIVHTNDSDMVAEVIYNNLDAETVSKITDIANTYNEKKLVEHQAFEHNSFAKVFETKRNDSKWLKENGLDGDIKWDLSHVSGNSGYHVIAAITKKDKLYGVLDHKAEIFCPFTHDKMVGLKIDTELRNRILSDGKKIDSFGRISPTGEITRQSEDGSLKRKLIIDGEVEALYTCYPEESNRPSTIELKADKALVEKSMISPNTLEHHDIDSLLDIKDRIYPPRVIKEGTNENLNKYIENSGKREKEQEKTKTENEVNDKKRIAETKLPMGLQLYNVNDKWGVKDSTGRTVLTPIWKTINAETDNSLTLIRTDSSGKDIRTNYQTEQLEELAQKLNRISDIHIERRGEHGDKWISGKIDDEPVISERLTEKDKDELEKGEVSELMLGVKYLAAYLAHDKNKEHEYGMKM